MVWVKSMIFITIRSFSGIFFDAERVSYETDFGKRILLDRVHFLIFIKLNMRLNHMAESFCPIHNTHKKSRNSGDHLRRL